MTLLAERKWLAPSALEFIQLGCRNVQVCTIGLAKRINKTK